MLKKLRIKIVALIVLVAAIMLGVIFGLFYSFTKQNLRSQSISVMQAIAANPFEPIQPEAQPQQVQLPYFVLRSDAFGNLMAIGSSNYDLTSRTFLTQVAAAAYRSPDTIGELEDYALRYYRTAGSVIFADISGERLVLQSLLRSGLLLCATGLLAFFLLAVLLARWAVRPVALAWSQQKQFIADASHELKTPLTVILTNAELLQSPEYDETQKRSFAEGVTAMAQQMRALIERMLELARAENSRTAAFGPVDLSALTETTALLFEAALYERGLSLQTQLEPGLVVHGESSQLGQLVEIFLDNARKYSDGGTVRVSLRACGWSRCRLCVENEGAPLSQQQLRDIFKRFTRADAARRRDGSFGLGLSIAQAIVQAHRGRLWAQSAGGINAFFVELPLAAGHEKHQAAPEKGI